MRGRAPIPGGVARPDPAPRPSGLPGSRAWLPLALVVVSLLGLLLTPVLIGRRMGSLRQQITAVTNPARNYVDEIELTLALEASAVRGYLVTGDSSFLEQYRQARARQQRSLRALEELVPRIGAEVERRASGFRSSKVLWSELTLALLGGEIAAEAFSRRLPEQQERFLAVLSESAGLEAAIAESESALRAEIARAQRLGTMLSGLLVALALAAAFLVAGLGRRLRSLAARLEQRAAEERRLREQVELSEHRFRELTENIREIFWITLPDNRVTYVSPAFDEIWGWSREELRADPGKWMEWIHPEDRERVVSRVRRDAETGGHDLEYRIIRPDGGVRWLRDRSFVVRDSTGTVERVVGIAEDVTGRKQAEERLVRQAGQREALARLGRHALAGADPQRLMQEAAQAVAGELEVSCAEVLEALPGGDDLLLRAGVGWKEGLVGRGRVEAGLGSQAGFTLLASAPVVAEDLRTESRFGVPTYLQEHGLVSGASVAIPAPKGLRGVLGAYSREGRSFSRDDVSFLQSVANIVGQAIERSRAETEIRRSQELFRTLADSIPQFAWMADPGGWIFWYNRRWYEYTGTTPEEMKGWGWQKVHHPDHVERVVERIRHSFETGTPWEDTFPLRSRTGEYRWFLSRALPIRDEAGNVVRWLGTNTDITEQLRSAEERDRLLELERKARGEAERRAREEEALREAVEAVTGSFTVETVIRRIAESALAATDADGAIVERIEIEQREVVVAAAAGRFSAALGTRLPLAGTFTEAVLERGEPEIVPRLDAAARPLPAELAEHCGGCSAMVLPLLDAGEEIGSLFLLREAGRRPFLPDEIDRATSFAYLASLAFRKVHLFEESERARRDLEQVMESRARLMRGFSHDVKNPLGAADGHLQLLEMGVTGEMNEKGRDSVARARRGIGDALRLIEDLLELARAEAGRIAVERQPVDVREATREVAEEYRAQAESKGLDLDVELPETLPIIESDAGRVRQVLGNLLSNAVKYTPAGKVSVRVRERRNGKAPRERRWVAVDVADTGPGISAEDQRVLFQEFRRLQGAVDQHGAGIGLAISQRVAEALGGRVSVESEPGRGSTFTLWLPIPEAEIVPG